MNLRLTREEKILQLRKLAARVVTPKDLIPVVRLHVYEKEPGYYGFALYDPSGIMEKIDLEFWDNGKIIFKGIFYVGKNPKLPENLLARLIKGAANFAKKQYPRTRFEWGVMHFEEYDRWSKQFEEEF